jgi:hypothetical protein
MATLTFSQHRRLVDAARRDHTSVTGPYLISGLHGRRRAIRPALNATCYSDDQQRLQLPSLPA